MRKRFDQMLGGLKESQITGVGSEWYKNKKSTAIVSNIFWLNFGRVQWIENWGINEIKYEGKK